MNTLYGIHPYLIDNWNTDFTANRDSAIKLWKAEWFLKWWDSIIVVNDIHNNGEEIPVVELIRI
jgi:hypothetical protein